MGGGNDWTPDQQSSFLRANMPWLQRMNQVNQEGPFGSVSWSGGGDHVAQPRDTGGGEGAGIEPAGTDSGLAEAMVTPPPSQGSMPSSGAPAQNAKPTPGKAAMPASPSGSAGKVNGDGLAEMMAKNRGM